MAMGKKSGKAVTDHGGKLVTGGKQRIAVDSCIMMMDECVKWPAAGTSIAMVVF